MKTVSESLGLLEWWSEEPGKSSPQKRKQQQQQKRNPEKKIPTMRINQRHIVNQETSTQEKLLNLG